MVRGTVVVGIVLVAVASDATAADMPMKAPPSPSTYDWSGFYVGGHVAYSLGGVVSTLSDPTSTGAENSFSSLYGGVQAGYNYVFPSRLLLGAEADIAFPNYFEDGTIFTAATPKGTSVT